MHVDICSCPIHSLPSVSGVVFPTLPTNNCAYQLLALKQQLFMRNRKLYFFRM